MTWEWVVLILGIVWALVFVIGLVAWSTTFNKDGLSE